MKGNSMDGTTLTLSDDDLATLGQMPAEEAREIVFNGLLAEEQKKDTKKLTSIEAAFRNRDLRIMAARIVRTIPPVPAAKPVTGIPAEITATRPAATPQSSFTPPQPKTEYGRATVIKKTFIVCNK